MLQSVSRQTHDYHEPHLLILLWDSGRDLPENDGRLYRLSWVADTSVCGPREPAGFSKSGCW